MENTEPKPNKTYAFFLTVSLIVNIILAIFSGYSGFRTAGLENEKKKIEVEKGLIEKERKQIEQELFIEKNIPHLSTFYLITSIDALNSFIKSKESFPFAQQIRRYRILETEPFARLSADMEKLRRKAHLGGTAHFLVVVNSGEINAYDAKLQKFDSATVAAGTIEPHSALLIPIYYEHNDDQHTQITPLYTSLAYDSKAGDFQRHYAETIQGPVNTSWVPTLGDLRGWGRAKPAEDNSHLKALIPH